MNLNSAIVSCPPHGECELDIEKAVKLFTNKCFISQYKDTFKLVRIRNKKAVALKAVISSKDARELIRRIGLTAIPSSTFNNAVTYRMAT